MAINFNELNFEVIDSNVNAYPDIYINQNGVTFSKKVVEDLGYPAYILCQLDPQNRVFAIRMCKSNEPKGFKFAKPRAEQKGTVSIGSKNDLLVLQLVNGEVLTKASSEYVNKITDFVVTNSTQNRLVKGIQDLSF